MKYFFVFLLFIAPQAIHGHSGNIPTGALIRDPEIEDTLKKVMQPLLDAANLKVGQVKPYIIADPELNASAGMGGVLLIHTGLILACENVEDRKSVV